jgi:omega-6 fatty acid desaturase (delta-12 desaturase)
MRDGLTADMTVLALADALPLPAKQPLPHRKQIRSWLEPMSDKKTAWAVFLLAFDLVLWTGAIALTVYVEHFLLKIVFGLIAGFVTGRIFILGHDACHQSFTPYRGLNKFLGRLAFLPSLTPYSLWEVGHNVVHHGQTNLKGFDFVWAPLSKLEYDALSPWRQKLEQVYRSGFGPALYYFIEIWWKRLFFPSQKYKPANRSVFLKDDLLISAFALTWIAVLMVAAKSTGQSVWVSLLAGFVVPTIFWNAMIGFVVYVHHTHAAVAWYGKKSEWIRAQPFVSTTVHLKFDYYLGSLLHHIMEHTAHHVDMGVPLYNLKAAQSELEERMPNRIIVQKFSWRWYFEAARTCKLYDFTNKAWLDFAGNTNAYSVPVELSA